MTTVKLSDGNEIKVPFSASDITNKQYYDFIECEKPVYKVTRVSDEAASYELALSEEDYSMHIIEAVSKICGDVSALPFKHGFDFDPNIEGITFGLQLTVRALYFQISGLINQLRPTLNINKNNTVEFDFKGEKYEINNAALVNSARVQADTLGIKAHDLTTGEFVEASMVCKALSAISDRATPNDKHFLDSNLCAILCRKRGEKLPSGVTEREVFISERVKIFEDLDMQTVCNISFFFESTMQVYLTAIVQSIYDNRETRRATAKASKRKQKQTQKQPKSTTATERKTTTKPQSVKVGLQKVV